MNTLKHASFAPPMILNAKTATDLMTPNPMSIGERASVGEAAAFLVRRSISAAPVIDGAGRPVGVVSYTDLLPHHSECAFHLVGSPEYYERLGRPAFAEAAVADDQLSACDVMTPGVFCVAPDTPAAKVVEKLVVLGVRRLFVVDFDGTLVGVISTVDVLRNLRRWGLEETAEPATAKWKRRLKLYSVN